MDENTLTHTMNDFTLQAFKAFAAQIAALNGISQTLAEDYLADAGDSPEDMEEQGRIVIIRHQDGTVRARLKWPMEHTE